MKEFDYDNDTDFKQLYDDLINEAKKRGLDKSEIDEYTEFHHIVPRCIGGSDDSENIVILTVKEHLLAHICLHKLYPDNQGLLLTISMMVPSRLTWNVITEEEIDEILKGREYKNRIQKRKVDVEGSREREEWKATLSKISKDRMNNPENRLTISNTLKNREDKSPLKLRSRKVMDGEGRIFSSVAECAEFYGFKSGVSISNKIKQGSTEFKYIEDKKPYTKIKGPDGTIYSSLRKCSELIGHTRGSIRNWIKNYPEKGFSLITS